MRPDPARARSAASAPAHPPPRPALLPPGVRRPSCARFVSQCPQQRVAGRKRKHPAICLLCGERVCVADPACCSEETAPTHDDARFSRRGGATTHAERCNAATTAVLLLKECLVLLMADGQRRVFWGSLYLDECVHRGVCAHSACTQIRSRH